MNFENIKVDKKIFKQYTKSKAYDKFYEPVVDIAIEQSDRIHGYKEELADVKNELANERRINDVLKVRADKFKADANKFKADANQQSDRIDDLQRRVDNLDGKISESYEQLASLETQIEDIDSETSELDAKNRDINKDLAILRKNDFEALDAETLINIGKSQIDVNCKRISCNNTQRHRLIDEVRDLEIRIKNMEAENYSIIRNMVKGA